MSSPSHKTSTSFIARPADANTIGTVFGGIILQHMDMTAAICARRYCGQRVTTVAVDDLRFIKPLQVGLVVRIEALICRTFHSSMDVQVMVSGENTYSGETFIAAVGYFTVVGLDENNKPTQVPQWAPCSPAEKKLWEEAGIRRNRRKRLTQPDESP